MLDSLPDSCEHERNELTKMISNLIYNNIVSELHRELERHIQNSIRQSSKSMNTFSLMNKMSRTLT